MGRPILSKIVLLIGLGLFGTALSAVAQPVPPYIDFQGRILDASGRSVTGPVDIEIGLFSAPTGGTVQYHEAHSAVPLVGGVYDILIGSGTATPGLHLFDPNLFMFQPLYVEVTINGETLSPRRQLASVGYSIWSWASDLASDSMGLGGQPPSTYDQSAHVLDTANPHGVTAAQAGAATAADLASHAAAPSAHHAKTTSFVDLLDSAADKQIPASVARDAEVLPLVLANDGKGSGLDADNLDGVSSGSFLRSNTSDSFTAGTLTLGTGTTMRVTGVLDIDNGGAGADSIGFGGGVGQFTWDTGTFGVNGRLETSGALRVGNLADPKTFNYFGPSSTVQPTSGDISSLGDLFVQYDLETGGELYLKSKLYMDAGTGADRDQSIYFRNAGNKAAEYLRWNDFEGRFDLSAPLRVDGNLTVTGAVALPANSIDEAELAPAVTQMLPVAFGNVYSDYGSTGFTARATGTTVGISISANMITLSAPPGCNNYSDCILIVTQATSTWSQVPQAVNQLEANNRFGVAIRGMNTGAIVSLPTGGFNVSFVIYKMP